jgi:DNA-binding MarR family transcriptional regulator
VSLPSNSEPVTRVQGWAAVPNWLIRDPSIDVTTKVVYLVLSSRVDRDSVCWPSQVTLAGEAGVSVPTVKRHLARLRGLGLVQVEVKVTATGRHNVYRLMAHPFR